MSPHRFLGVYCTDLIRPHQLRLPLFTSIVFLCSHQSSSSVHINRLPLRRQRIQIPSSEGMTWQRVHFFLSSSMFVRVIFIYATQPSRGGGNLVKLTDYNTYQIQWGADIGLAFQFLLSLV
jgi:hypothetical protein